MKKIFFLSILLSLTACSAYHTGRTGMTISNPDIEFTPQEAKINIDTHNRIVGSAECSSFLWIFNSVPERQMYGVNILANDGNFASADCVAAAVYNAAGTMDTDIIVGLQYTTIRDGILCFGSRCLFGTTKVLVKGFPGKITAITDMERSVVHEKQKANKSSSSSSSSAITNFLF